MYVTCLENWCSSVLQDYNLTKNYPSNTECQLKARFRVVSKLVLNGVKPKQKTKKERLVSRLVTTYYLLPWALLSAVRKEISSCTNVATPKTKNKQIQPPGRSNSSNSSNSSNRAAQLLLPLEAMNATPAVVDKYELTPLMRAATEVDSIPLLVKMLMDDKIKATLFSTDRKGRTALDWSRMCRNYHAVSLLTKAMSVSIYDARLDEICAAVDVPEHLRATNKSQ